jgi:hypothetical protein
MATKQPKFVKARKRGTEKAMLDEIERKQWPELEKRLASARANMAKGKLRKWNLERVLNEVEKRRRAKLAAE